MKNKKFNIYDLVEGKAEITISTGVKEIHPLVETIASNLTNLEHIRFIRITPDTLFASSEISEGRIPIPITKPDHPTASGVQLIIDQAFNYIQFYEITSSVQGYGGKMVDVVIKALPIDWQAIVVMDWSQGFWERMIEKYDNLSRL